MKNIFLMRKGGEKVDKKESIEQSTIGQELKLAMVIIKEIKAHVMEGGIPSAGSASKELPMASHKLINLKEDIRGISRELEEILKAVALL